MTSGPSAERDVEEGSKRFKSSEGCELPSLQEVESYGTRQLKELCKKLGIYAYKKKSSARSLLELLKRNVDFPDEEEVEQPTSNEKPAEVSQNGSPESPAGQKQPSVLAPKEDHGELALATLERLSTYLDEVAKDYKNGQELLTSAQTLLEGFLGGLRLSLTSRRRTTYDRDFPPCSGADELGNPRKWKDVVERGPENSQYEPTKNSKPLRPSNQERTETLNNLRKLKAVSHDSTRQGIWEPEMANYKKMEIAEPLFRKEVNEALKEMFDIDEGVQFCKRLERGG